MKARKIPTRKERFKTIKAACEAGFRAIPQGYYGGEQIVVKGRLLAKDPIRAKSRTEWKALGYTVPDDAEPHGFFYSQSHGRSFHYSVYREDQVVPLSEESKRRSKAAKTAAPKAVATRRINERKRQRAERREEREYWKAIAAAADEIGALPNSRIAEDYANGALDKYEASYLAFQTRYRHHFTDYDDQWNSHEVQQLLDDPENRDIEASCLRDELRYNLVEEPIPGNWADYLTKYGFDSEIAKALAAALAEPKQAHPVWFKRAEQAVARAIDNGKSIDLNTLTYGQIKKCLDNGRPPRQPKWQRPR